MSRKDHSSSAVKQTVIGVIWDSCRREAYHRYLALPTSTRVGPFPPTFVDKPSHDWRTQRSFHAGATRPDITHENVALCEGDRERESHREEVRFHSGSKREEKKERTRQKKQRTNARWLFLSARAKKIAWSVSVCGTESGKNERKFHIFSCALDPRRYKSHK